MTFQALIKMHRDAICNLALIRADRRYRSMTPTQRQIYTDWASI